MHKNNIAILSDEILIEKCLNEDIEYFNELYQRYFQLIYKLVWMYIKEEEQVKDIVSDIFIKIVEKLNSFDQNKASFKTWIYTITKNTVKDYFKTKKDSMCLDNINFQNNISYEENLAKIIDEKDDKIKIMKYINENLSTEKQTIIFLKCYADMTFDDISKIINKNIGATKMMYYKTIEKIKKDLNYK